MHAPSDMPCGPRRGMLVSLVLHAIFLGVAACWVIEHRRVEQHDPGAHRESLLVRITTAIRENVAPSKPPALLTTPTATRTWLESPPRRIEPDDDLPLLTLPTWEGKPVHPNPVHVEIAIPPGKLTRSSPPHRGNTASTARPPGNAGNSFTPPALVHAPAPKYPAASIAKGERGIVAVHVRVLPDGSVAKATLFRTCGAERLDLAAVAAARNWRFAPWDPSLHPAPASVIVTVTFQG